MHIYNRDDLKYVHHIHPYIEGIDVKTMRQSLSKEMYRAHAFQHQLLFYGAEPVFVGKNQIIDVLLLKSEWRLWLRQETRNDMSEDIQVSLLDTYVSTKICIV